jgi:hypothetical protein
VKEELKYTMDRDLLYRVCRKHKIFLVNRAYGAFRRHDGSKSGSSILPFSKEFARLYLLHLSGNKAEDRLRKQMSRYLLASGCIKYSKTTHCLRSATAALITALLYKPDYMFQQSYISAWLEVLHLKRFLKSFFKDKVFLA